MDQLFAALGNPLRVLVLRELARSPGLKYGEILSALEMSRAKAGVLTKALDPLEGSGLVVREEGRYGVVNRVAILKLLAVGSELDVEARRRLAEQAQKEIPTAEETAAELRKELREIESEGPETP